MAEIRQVRKPLEEVAWEMGERLGEIVGVSQKLGLSLDMERILNCEIAVGLLMKDRYLAERRENEIDVAIGVLRWEIEERKKGLKWWMGFKETEGVKMSLGLIGRAANLVSAVYTQRVKDSLYSDPSEMGEEVKEAMGIALDSFVRSEEKNIKKLSS